MTILEIASACFIVLLLLIFMGSVLYGMLGPQPQYKPMSYDEEVRWLMNQGLTEEQAKEIADQ